MSRNRETQRHTHDFGYGQACTEDGTAPGTDIGADQEHGVVAHVSSPDVEIAKTFPIATRLRILPNHACATEVQHPEYRAVSEDSSTEVWPHFYRW